MSMMRPLETQENLLLKETARRSAERVARALERLQRKLSETDSICEESHDEDFLHKHGD